VDLRILGWVHLLAYLNMQSANASVCFSNGERATRTRCVSVVGRVAWSFASRPRHVAPLTGCAGQLQVFLAAAGCFMKPRAAAICVHAMKALQCRAGLPLQSHTADIEAPIKIASDGLGREHRSEAGEAGRLRVRVVSSDEPSLPFDWTLDTRD
jgi:hypothetical protein